MAQSVGVLGYRCPWGPPPEQEYTVNASAGVEAGQLVYLAATKLLTAVATNGVLCIGWASQDAAVNEQCKVMRAFPGVSMEMKFAGTWNFGAMLGQLVEITVTAGSDIVDVDANTNHLFKIEELLSNTATDKRVLVSLAAAANQNIIEVA